ncbi:hypothetical protein D9C73_008177 [Collichthys lucidus]|uniref:Uncharacterized protein n=1 Tax=Collichthys lucidus TaxID=240159 RepID=A0A4U5UH80_COLLU|nr:hypothetical protein D9C73_008177 [Collichthys lucidus]
MKATAVYGFLVLLFQYVCFSLSVDQAPSRRVVITTPTNADNMDQAPSRRVVITTLTNADNMDQAPSRRVVITTPTDADNNESIKLSSECQTRLSVLRAEGGAPGVLGVFKNMETRDKTSRGLKATANIEKEKMSEATLNCPTKSAQSAKVSNAVAGYLLKSDTDAENTNTVLFSTSCNLQLFSSLLTQHIQN